MKSFLVVLIFATINLICANVIPISSYNEANTDSNVVVELPKTIDEMLHRVLDQGILFELEYCWNTLRKETNESKLQTGMVAGYVLNYLKVLPELEKIEVDNYWKNHLELMKNILDFDMLYYSRFYQDTMNGTDMQFNEDEFNKGSIKEQYPHIKFILQICKEDDASLSSNVTNGDSTMNLILQFISSIFSAISKFFLNIMRFFRIH